jgi:hypothetical protein
MPREFGQIRGGTYPMKSLDMAIDVAEKNLVED